MTGETIREDATATTSDADGEPPSPSVVRIVDRRAPGGAAARIEIDLRSLDGHAGRLSALIDRPHEIAVALLDDEEMDRLHREHSGVAGTTDVLSYPGEDGSDGIVTGDLAIGVEVASREATRRARSIEAELMLYIVHGLLHLLGERDGDEDSRTRMIRAQDRLLEALGLPRTEEDGPDRRGGAEGSG